MNSVPPLHTYNQFSCLATTNEEVLAPIPQTENLTKVTTPLPPKVPYLRLQKWERRLPTRYVIASSPGPKSLTVKVKIQAMDTGEIMSGPALIDCGATSQFMDWVYVERHHLTNWKLQHAIPVYNVDRTLSEAGSITEIVDVILRLDGHSEGPPLQSPVLGDRRSSSDSPG